jgi:type I restriction-modification system DNA methylase subunit
MPLNILIADCIEQIVDQITTQQKHLSNRELLAICNPIGQIQTGTINPHLPHEIAEAAINSIIQTTIAREFLTTRIPFEPYNRILKPLASRIPTQTWRSTEQNEWQQFSTPPGIAFLLAFLLNLKPCEQVLEPSAGTGSLAVWSSGLGAKTQTNEIDERRRVLLKSFGFEPTSYNAEFIHDLLPSEIQPDCILMNPPFSSNGGRTKNNSSKFGFRHVESAIERLKPGGKFGIILGNSGGLDTKIGREFWQKLCSKVSIKAILKIAGKEYAKNGTSVDVNLIIGTKRLQPIEVGVNLFPCDIITLSFTSIEDGFDALQKYDIRLQ